MIAWDNWWKWCAFVPGTAGPRILLTGYRFGLFGIVGLGATLGSEQAGRWGAAGGGALAAWVAFFIHELFFAAYVRYIVRIPLMDDGSVVGRDHHADYTFEGWIGPVV